MKVLFVCLGNICRSPTAEGVFRAAIEREGLDDVVEIDSAGCAAYHTGELPDPRTRQAALGRGIDLSNQRARKLVRADLERFDFILCADRDNLAHVEDLASNAGGADQVRAELGLFLSYAGGEHDGVDEIPDPYYGGEAGFEHVLDLCEAASVGLIEHLRQRLAG